MELKESMAVYIRPLTVKREEGLGVVTTLGVRELCREGHGSNLSEKKARTYALKGFLFYLVIQYKVLWKTKSFHAIFLNGHSMKKIHKAYLNSCTSTSKSN